ncbi:hypothetical protein Cgig2_033557 [Carnegiea gigantea]|uniref:Uncharacterized protein n=1 Tax=Carnegiea gigantea TaxID=171969 RepID=A0A9Q1JTX6_9CARY|nr:hypothetical protein Cgig2_033557 [Carnegiea gigantea]
MSLLWPRKLLSTSSSPNWPRSSSIGFEAWVWQSGNQILEARFQEEVEQKEESLDTEGATSPSDDDKHKENKRERRREGPLHAPFIMVFPPLHDSREMADFRSTTYPPCPLLDDYQDLCLRFTLSDAERAALDFELPKMVQVRFYAMLLNDAVELGIVSGFIAVDLKLTLEGMRWTSFEAWLSRTSRKLGEAQLCLSSQGPRHRDGGRICPGHLLMASEGGLSSVPKPSPYGLSRPLPGF